MNLPPTMPDPSEAICYVRSRRAKRLSITLKPDLSVRVTMPIGLPLEKARSFVNAHKDWIQTHRCRIVRRRQEVPPAPPLPDIHPAELPFKQDELFERLAAFSARHNLPYHQASFRCQKTRWGSCSHRHHISLNINMIFLPSHLQDYILLHELTHIRHPNHGRAFWSELDGFCGGKAKVMQKELKRYRLPLMPGR